MAATRSSELLAELADFVAIPSVSSDPARRDDMRRAADWVAQRLAFAGGSVVETDGHPVVVAECLAARPGAPTILVYGHYDVQPAGDESLWDSPPFEASVRDGRVYGRGTTDDKGPVVVALETARRFVEAGGAPLDVRFVIEGEEEIGSPSLAAFLDAHRDELGADLVVSADGAMWRSSEPSISIAAKGLLALDVIVTGAATDLHSGRHGGAVANPNHALAAIVASFHSADGSVAVDGFYDDVAPLGDADRAGLAEVPFDEEAYRESVGASELHGEPGWSTLERLWTRPTLEVNELRGGGAFTVIPREASAHITCRLVPDQRPETVLASIAAHVDRVAPTGVAVRVEAREGAVPAYAIPADHRAVRAAQVALATVYPDRPALLVRMGGTLPAASIFEQVLGLKTLMFSFSTGDENLHAPNEFFRVSRLEEGVAAWTELWLQLGEPGAMKASMPTSA
jgi:acetylornithine deacetylase/succinyl-diaminopimelate desuccinylase-like protein